MIRRPPRSTLFPTRRSSDLTLRARLTCGLVVLLALSCAAVGIAAVVTLRSFLTERLDQQLEQAAIDRKSTRLNSSHLGISYAVFCLKKKKKTQHNDTSYIMS